MRVHHHLKRLSRLFRRRRERRSSFCRRRRPLTSWVKVDREWWGDRRRLSARRLLRRDVRSLSVVRIIIVAIIDWRSRPFAFHHLTLLLLLDVTIKVRHLEERITLLLSWKKWSIESDELKLIEIRITLYCRLGKKNVWVISQVNYNSNEAYNWKFSFFLFLYL
jgi:hypothetical protein